MRLPTRYTRFQSRQGHLPHAARRDASSRVLQSKNGQVFRENRPELRPSSGGKAATAKDTLSPFMAATTRKRPALPVLLHLQSPPFLDHCLQASLLPLQLLLGLRLALLLRVAVAQVHLDQVRRDEANDQHALAGQRNLAAGGEKPETVEKHEAYQPKLVPEP
eukprot:scaffold28236_cov59-Phaeocystis_antarctica.AAC.12